MGDGEWGHDFSAQVGGKLENPSAFLRLHRELAAASPNLPVECRGLIVCIVFSIQYMGDEKKNVNIKIGRDNTTM